MTDDVAEHFAGTDVMATQAHEPTVRADESQDEEMKRTHAQILIEMAGQAELFHDGGFSPYATIPVNGHNETWPLRSRGFTGWLKRQFYEREGKPPSNQAFSDALGMLEAKAQFDGTAQEVFVRIGGFEDSIYVDLGNESWDVVEISAGGWKIIENPPVKFRRPKNLSALPIPQKGGSVDGLDDFINCRNESDLKLLKGWIVGTFHPTGPYPVLDLQGEHGSAKSTVTKVLKQLTDPSHAKTRSVPRSEHDLVIMAQNGHTLCFDNLSVIRDWFSDALCRLATGGGFSTRELYSNSEEAIFNDTAPIILNGIEDLATRPDMISRSIIINLPAISPHKRKLEKDFWRDFDEMAPYIIGAIFDAVSGALKEHEQTHLDGYPRMADFARWVTAAESALRWSKGSFMGAYSENNRNAIEIGLEASHLACAVRAMMGKRTEWEGSPTELMEVLGMEVKDTVEASKEWPKATNINSKLRVLKSPLREIGIEIESTRTSSKRIITIKRAKNAEK